MPSTWEPEAPLSGLAPGDRVQIVVFQQEDLSGEFALDAEANLAMPLVGNIPARGLSTKQLQEAIVDHLKPDYLRDPKVTVDRISMRPVYLLGEVKQPGSYEHSEALSVAKAVALAGGLTYRASKQRISIRRVDADGQVREFPADMNTPVHGGDLINVSERFF
ncbi:MAG: polysaccharide biosynthesis/export family protein [Pseudomonadales bacterium]